MHRDGVDIAVERRAGDAGFGVVAVHATGFCKETWGPVLAALPGVAAVAIDQRGHGASTVGDPPFDWWHLGGDVLAVIEEASPAPGRIGLGHSSGGAALAMAEILVPGTFQALVLVEPIVFPGPYARAEENPLTAGALRRRRSFPSLEAVLESFRGGDPSPGGPTRPWRPTPPTGPSTPVTAPGGSPATRRWRRSSTEPPPPTEPGSGWARSPAR